VSRPTFERRTSQIQVQNATVAPACPTAGTGSCTPDTSHKHCRLYSSHVLWRGSGVPETPVSTEEVSLGTPQFLRRCDGSQKCNVSRNIICWKCRAPLCIVWHAILLFREVYRPAAMWRWWAVLASNNLYRQTYRGSDRGVIFYDRYISYRSAVTSSRVHGSHPGIKGTFTLLTLFWKK
jgi:hypothetical protein